MTKLYLSISAVREAMRTDPDTFRSEKSLFALIGYGARESKAIASPRSDAELELLSTIKADRVEWLSGAELYDAILAVICLLIYHGQGVPDLPAKPDCSVKYTYERLAEFFREQKSLKILW